MILHILIKSNANYYAALTIIQNIDHSTDSLYDLLTIINQELSLVRLVLEKSTLSFLEFPTEEVDCFIVIGDGIIVGSIVLKGL